MREDKLKQRRINVLDYSDARAAAQGTRRALGAGVWSLLSPITIAGALYLTVEGVIDLDDIFPAPWPVMIIGLIGVGVPLSGVMVGCASRTQSSTHAAKRFSTLAIVFGVVWASLAAILWMALFSMT